MPMYFTSGHDIGKFLFKGWIVDSPSRYALAWLLIFMLGVTNEFLGYLRQVVCSSASRKSGVLMSPESDEIQGGRRELTMTKKLFLTVLYFINVSISYGLMLVTMTYNVGLFFAVVLGLSLGHFIFKISISSRRAAYYGESTTMQTGTYIHISII